MVDTVIDELKFHFGLEIFFSRKLYKPHTALYTCKFMFIHHEAALGGLKILG